MGVSSPAAYFCPHPENMKPNLLSGVVVVVGAQKAPISTYIPHVESARAICKGPTKERATVKPLSWSACQSRRRVMKLHSNLLGSHHFYQSSRTGKRSSWRPLLSPLVSVDRISCIFSDIRSAVLSNWPKAALISPHSL